MYGNVFFYLNSVFLVTIYWHLIDAVQGLKTKKPNRYTAL